MQTTCDIPANYLQQTTCNPNLANLSANWIIVPSVRRIFVRTKLFILHFAFDIEMTFALFMLFVHVHVALFSPLPIAVGDFPQRGLERRWNLLLTLRFVGIE